jgi:translation elongation factor EF-Tu-like GTPase
MAKRWHLVVEDSFMITGRGLVVVGKLHGAMQLGEPGLVRTGEISLKVDRVYFDTFRGGREGYFGLTLRGLAKEQVPVGAVVEALD